MFDLFNQIKDLIAFLLQTGKLGDWLSLVAALASVVGAVFGVFQAWVRSRYREQQFEKTDAFEQLNIQIAHIRDYLAQQLYQERISRWSHYMLNFSQYVVGAALTTSFIADNLSGRILGVLGVITLLSSFAQQQLRPDIKRLAAARRIIDLKGILRSAEIAAAGAVGNQDPKEYIVLAQMYLERLDRVQRDEWIQQRKDNPDHS